MRRLSVKFAAIKPKLFGGIAGENLPAVLIRGTNAALVAKVVAAGCVFASQIVLARMMAIENYGTFVYAAAIINIIALLAALGLDTSLTRFIPEYTSTQQWSKLCGVIRISLRLSLLCATLIAVAAIAVIMFSELPIGRQQEHTMLIAFIALPLLTLVRVHQAGLRGFRRVVQSELPENIIRPLLLIAMALPVLVFLPAKYQAPVAMAMNTLALLVALVVAHHWLHRARPRDAHQVRPDYATAHWIRVSFPLFAISGMHIILGQTDVIMLGAIAGAEQAGIYNAAARIAGLVAFGLMASNSMVAPMIAELYANGRLNELQQLITIAARWVFVFTLVAALLLAVLGNYALGLFGAVFTFGFMPMMILTGGQVINAIVGPVGFLMTMTGHQNHAALIMSISAICNVALNFIMIPIFGSKGAAIATVVSLVIWNVAMLIYVRRNLNITPLAFRVL